MFINKNVGLGGHVVAACATALAEDVSLSGWGREGKRTGYFLLSSSGSGRKRGRMRLVAGRHRRGEVPLSSLPVPVPQHTHLEAPRHPPTHLCPQPPLPPATAAPAAHGSAASQRDAAQPSRQWCPGPGSATPTE